MQKKLLFTIAFISVFFGTYVHPSFANSMDEISEYAKEDSKYFLGKKGEYTEKNDNHLITTDITYCQLGLDINNGENNFTSLSINVGAKTSDNMSPSVSFYISSSGKTPLLTGEKGTSNRIIFDDGSAAFGPPTLVTESSTVCRSWGSTSKPTIKLFSEFVISDDSVTFVMDYRCGLLDSDKHTLVKTCTFFK